MAELLRDSVYRAIRSAILTCELQPGQDLREQILAQKYRVSRSPIRDALLRLEQDKLVKVLPRQGYRVNAICAGAVRELFGLRLVIAPACAAEAARADDRAVRNLDRFRDVGEELTQEGFLEHNRDFHAAIAHLAGNLRLAAVEIGLVEEFHRMLLVSFKAQDIQWIPAAVAEHRTIIAAIQAHDSDVASRLVHAHLAAQQRHMASLSLKE